MILTGSEIIKEFEKGRIDIRPFDASQVNPNSYDFRLGPVMRSYTNHVLNPHFENPTVLFPIPEEGMILDPGKLYLGHTLEIMGSDHYVPIIHGKSSIARLGLFIHVTADL